MASLCNADDDELGLKYDDELLANVSADECTVDVPKDENKEPRRIRWLKNARRALRRRNAENRARNPLHQRNLNNTFAAGANR
jgi:hypothetical protein